MGANLVALRFPGSLNRDELLGEFRAAQEVDLYENGHSYSGGIGMASGLRIEPPTFDTHREAMPFLQEKVRKWEEALAVYVDNPDGKPYWLVAALCAS